MEKELYNNPFSLSLSKADPRRVVQAHHERTRTLGTTLPMQGTINVGIGEAVWFLGLEWLYEIGCSNRSSRLLVGRTKRGAGGEY